MPSEHILIVDDEPAIQATLRGVLEDEGYRVTAVGSGADALRVVADEPPDLTFLDIWMERMDGLETLAEIKRLRPDALVVMISGHGTIETAVKATKLGAYDFIEKPLSLEKTLLTVTRALEHARLARENATLRESLVERAEIIGDSEPVRRLREQIATAAPTTGRVLIRGENGSGKELVARAIHARSARREQPFVEANCTARPEAPIESALFCAENGKRPRTVSGEALGYFLAYDWPGNVRELRNMVERLVIMTRGDVIGADDLPAPLRPKAAVPAGEASERSLREARENFERAYILAELRANDWNMTRTSERLGIERSHLYRKLKAYNITPPRRDS